MKYLEISSSLELREAPAESDLAATVEGLAVPYGVTTQVGQLRESFAPGSIDPADAIGKPLCWRHGDPIGVITAAENTDQGLWVTADIADTSLGRDAAKLLRTRALKGMSVGFTPLEDAWNRTRDTVTRVRATLGELSLTHQPAYATAGVSVIREETPMPEQAETPAVPEQAQQQRELNYATQDDLSALRERIASIQVAPVQRRELSADEYLRELGTQLVTRAFTDITLDGSAEDIAPVPSGVTGVVEFARPTVSAIGVDTLPPQGMDATWMLDNVLPVIGEQTAELGDVPSSDPSGQLVTAPVKTYTGGNRVSLQWLQRASVWDYPHLMRLYAEQYARKTNAVVATDVQAAAANTILMPSTITLPELAGKLGWGASKIAAATGRAPSVVVLDPTKFFQVGMQVGAGFPIAGGTSVGSASLSGLSFSALGLTWICDATLVNGGYMLDRSSIGIKESSGAPFQLSQTVVPNLGQEIALYGYMAHKILNPGGIVSFFDDTAAAASSTKAGK